MYSIHTKYIRNIIDLFIIYKTHPTKTYCIPSPPTPTHTHTHIHIQQHEHINI